MNYKEAHEYLDSLLVFGIKLGLENMKVLCDLLGNPQNDLKFIHLAGTNGKGSCCAMIASALKRVGLKTGFYSSPFLYNFTERWRVNGLEVSESQVAEAISRIAELEPQLEAVTGVRPTYFEVLTAAALLIFKNESVDVVVWETGMGGRLDATNVVKPLVSVITNIELDHTQYLGDTLEKIAFEKGGIVKEGIPFITGETKEPVVDYFESLAKECNCDFYARGKDFDIQIGEVSWSSGKYVRELIYRSPLNQNLKISLPVPGRYQCDNAAIALKALELACEILSVSFDDAIKGLECFIWPGRMEVRDNGLILDGAHNPGGAKALLETLKEIKPDQKFHFICGILSDKSWREVLDTFGEVAESFFFVKVKNERTSTTADLSGYASLNGFTVVGEGGAEEALSQIKRPENTVVVGSLYLIGEVLSILNNREPARIDSL